MAITFANTTKMGSIKRTKLCIWNINLMDAIKWISHSSGLTHIRQQITRKKSCRNVRICFEIWRAPKILFQNISSVEKFKYNRHTKKMIGEKTPVYGMNSILQDMRHSSANFEKYFCLLRRLLYIEYFAEKTLNTDTHIRKRHVEYEYYGA